MAISPLIQAEGLLICLFTVYDEVSSSWGDCWDPWCGNGPKVPTWFIIVASIFGVVFGCTCFVRFCSWCCKAYQGSGVNSHSEEPTTNLPTQTSAFVLPVPPLAPSPEAFGEPPPYSEIAWKPYFYPAPPSQPPAYDNIAMEGRPPVDVSSPPGSMPKDTF